MYAKEKMFLEICESKYKFSILMITQMKAKRNIIEIVHIFQISHTELIICGSGSGKTNVLLNLIDNQPDIDKIYLYVKDPYEA